MACAGFMQSLACSSQLPCSHSHGIKRHHPLSDHTPHLDDLLIRHELAGFPQLNLALLDGGIQKADAVQARLRSEGQGVCVVGRCSLLVGHTPRKLQPVACMQPPRRDWGVSAIEPHATSTPCVGESAVAGVCPRQGA